MEDEQIYLDEVINLYLSASEFPDGRYMGVAALGLRGLRFIHAQATAQPVQLEVDVEDSGSAKFPGGCLNIIRVSRDPHGNHPMIADAQLGLRDVDCDCHGSHEDGCHYNNYRDSYRIDAKTRSIYVDHSMIGQSLFVEYIPLLENDGKYIVDPMFVEALLAWMGWQDMRRSRGDRADSRNEFFNFFRIGKRSQTPFVYAELVKKYKRDYITLTS